MSKKLSEEWIENATVGGAILGGGGGGSLDKGKKIGEIAIRYGRPEIKPLSELEEESLILTVSAVGAPAADHQYVKPADYVKSAEIAIENLKGKVSAIMSSEMGGFATVNGLIQSSALEIPMADAACDGRAHPTGEMGSMALSSDREVLQTGVGGNPDEGRRIELHVQAPLGISSKVIREGAKKAGGLVAVARNPVKVEYARDNAATGVYDQVIRLGKRIRRSRGGLEAAKEAADLLDGEVPLYGEIDKFMLETEEGFDVGKAVIEGGELTFWNEFMTFEVGGERIATFPDLISTLDLEDGLPLSTADLEEGREVVVLTAPHTSLNLGSGVEDAENLREIERAIDKPILRHLDPTP